ncbi:CelD/BcsL family acetyltransferase involved in cellulose biosynthesis [Microvirga subterranea]|uniref:CelD/BcsL family acetyltransferase involved in cellulose biosynthesis n=2 Tax=Microvirga subterranea TaxID=186651 RepID=A0A370HM86_9HYPH|nr:CelD/BcsL family acetyltransferase involved in cellulose biosynthesis [Microvirga subterranea]
MRDSTMAIADLSLVSYAAARASASDDVQVVTVHEFDGLASHVPAWDQLANRAPQQIPTLLPAWIDAFLHHRLRSKERWLCCFAYREGALIGVLPVVITPHPILGISRPILRTPSDDLTPSGDVLLAPEYAGLAFCALLEEVRREIPGHLGLSLTAVRHGAPVLQVLRSGVQGYVRCSGLCSKFSFLNVQGRFDDYLAGLGNMRRNLKRFHKKLEKQGAVSIDRIQGAQAGMDFLETFMALEASGWKGRNGTAMADNTEAVSFYQALAEHLGARGDFEWYVIRVQGQVIAAQMCIRCGGSLMLAKIAFDEDYSDCRPGHLLTGSVIQDAFARPEIIEINHLSNADWEGYWRMTYDEYVDVQLIRRDILPILCQFPRAAAHYAYQRYARPRIPSRLKQAYRAYRRRGDRKPLRSADSRTVRKERLADPSSE